LDLRWACADEVFLESLLKLLEMESDDEEFRDSVKSLFFALADEIRHFAPDDGPGTRFLAKNRERILKLQF
jgi:hypothetical protein